MSALNSYVEGHGSHIDSASSGTWACDLRSRAVWSLVTHADAYTHAAVYHVSLV